MQYNTIQYNTIQYNIETFYKGTNSAMYLSNIVIIKASAHFKDVHCSLWPKKDNANTLQ